MIAIFHFKVVSKSAFDHGTVREYREVSGSENRVAVLHVAYIVSKRCAFLTCRGINITVIDNARGVKLDAFDSIGFAVTIGRTSCKVMPSSSILLSIKTRQWFRAFFLLPRVCVQLFIQKHESRFQ